MKTPRPSRRHVLGAAALSAVAPAIHAGRRARRAGPVMVGSANALRGMRLAYPVLVDGGDPMDAAINTVKVTEADPDDHSVGLGGLPNEDGVVQLDAACMDGRTHNSGAVGALENILHPSEVARLVMERTDHCQIFGEGAYRFARSHGHEHVELLTEKARQIWMRWKESMSGNDDRLSPKGPEDERYGALPSRFERHGTIHCSVLTAGGEVVCTTTTSGLAWKIPGRVGDSPIVGAGLYCDAEAGSAGATGRGEAAILSCGSASIVDALRRGATPLEAGMEVLERIVRQTKRMAAWQPSLVAENGEPAFGLNFYVLDLQGRHAGVTLRGKGKKYAAADPEGGPRHLPLVPLL